DWAVAASAGVAGMLADNQLNVSLHFAVPAFVFWWQAGAAMGFAKPQGEPVWRLRFPGRAPAIAAALFVSGFCAIYAGWWFRQWNREAHYFLGFKLLHAGRIPGAIQELEAAYGWDPHEVNADYELGN